MSFDWKSIVRNVAPEIASFLGTPAAGVATKFLADQFLGDPKASEKDVASAIQNASPDQLLKLKQCDQDFKEKMASLNLDAQKLVIQDRDSARQLFKVNIWPQIILSALFVIGYFSLIGILIWMMSKDGLQINVQILGILTTVLGVLTAAIPQIMQFWFGSSKGSKDKDAGLLSNLAKQSPQGGNAGG